MGRRGQDDRRRVQSDRRATDQALELEDRGTYIAQTENASKLETYVEENEYIYVNAHLTATKQSPEQVDTALARASDYWNEWQVSVRYWQAKDMH